MAKKPRFPEHRMGRRSGYEVYADGSISLAPMWTDRMSAMGDREVGLREMQHSVTVYVADEFTRLAKERKAWWDEVFEELEIPRCGDRWEYDGRYLRNLGPASGMRASGQDPQGLEAKPASPTAESGDAQ